MTTKAYIAKLKIFASLFTKKEIFTPIPLLALLLAFSGCDLLDKQAPDIENVLTADSQISGLIDIDALPIDWERASELWTQYEPRFREEFGDEWVEKIKQSQIKANDFSKIVLSVDSFDFTSEADFLANLQNTRWILAVDMHGFLPADLIEFGINSQTNSSGLIAKRNDNWASFERIDIYETKQDSFVCSIAVFSAKTTQIRIGQPEKLEKSIVEPAGEFEIAAQKLIPEHQLWMHFEIPEELLAEVSQMENLLPIDTGALLSGFKSVYTSSQVTDYALNSLITFEFDNRESADTAFSILSLSNTFLLKPALKRTVGDAKHFIKSIDAERNQDWVQYRYSIDADDALIIKNAISKEENSALLSYAFDLINKR